MVSPCSTWTGSTVINVLWRKMCPEPAGAVWRCSPGRDTKLWWIPWVPGVIICGWNRNLATGLQANAVVCTAASQRLASFFAQNNPSENIPWSLPQSSRKPPGQGSLKSSAPSFVLGSSPFSAPWEQAHKTLQTNSNQPSQLSNRGYKPAGQVEAYF